MNVLIGFSHQGFAPVADPVAGYNGSFTLHGTGNGNGTGNDGFMYFAMYCSHYTGTGTGTGKWWISVLHYVLYTLHRDRDRWVSILHYVLFTLHRDREREQGPLGYIPIFPFLVPCSVNAPYGGGDQATLNLCGRILL